MPNLPTLSGRKVVKVFESFGWEVVRRAMRDLVFVIVMCDQILDLKRGELRTSAQGVEGGHYPACVLRNRKLLYETVACGFATHTSFISATHLAA